MRLPFAWHRLQPVHYFSSAVHSGRLCLVNCYCSVEPPLDRARVVEQIDMRVYLGNCQEGIMRLRIGEKARSQIVDRVLSGSQMAADQFLALVMQAQHPLVKR